MESEEISMSSREQILGNIRKSLGRGALSGEQISVLEARLATPPLHEQPQVNTDLVQQFTQKLQKVGASFSEVENESLIPFALIALLKEWSLPLQVVIDAHLQTLPWNSDIQYAVRAAQDEDKVSVTEAFAAVAETGTVALLSSHSPTTLNFLPETHVVIVRRAQITANLESVWEKLRQQAIPRTVNLITGPSRTADVEQTIQLGAHGPRQLHVVLVA
jgi:L-lactate dehydrogenase complex protein LldG